MAQELNDIAVNVTNNPATPITLTVPTSQATLTVYLSEHTAAWLITALGEKLRYVRKREGR